jgi:membrane protein required for colicin V production
MPLVDILIGVGILVFLVLGFRDGFFKRLFSVLGLILGLICATKFMTPASEILQDSLGFSKDVSNVLAFSAIFCIIIMLENLSYRWFGKSGDDTLPFWSRIAGAFIGAGQGAIAVSLVLIFLSVFGVPEKESIENSDLYAPVMRLAPKVFDISTSWMPESKNFVQELKDRFENITIPD